MKERPPRAGSPAIAGDPWQRIPPGHGWRELVIPDSQLESLREVTTRLSAEQGKTGDAHRRASGPILLFSGPAGTGKTMAARIIGAQLGTPLLEVDTTALRARDRAGLEALLGRVFATARAENAILFFDHADTLLGERPVRSRHHTRPGALTAPDLLERTERHSAPVIFASALRGKIDPAYRSRFLSVIEFPFPDAEARKQIWRQLLPGRTNLTQADIEELGGSFQLPGAAIAACCAAASLAAQSHKGPVKLIDVAQAVQAEYRGRLASDSTLAAVATLVERARAADSEPRAAASRSAGSDPARPYERADGPSNGAAHVPSSNHVGDTRTNGDRRRQASGFEPASSRRRWPPPESLPAPASLMSVARRAGYALVVFGAVLAAAGIGFAASQLTGGTQTARAAQVTAGPVRASLPPRWRPALGRSPTLGLTNELTLAPAGDRRVQLTIGTVAPGDPDLLPASLVSAVRSIPAAQITSIGALSFYRYPNLVRLPNGTTESVYATPTTFGTLVGVCTAPPSNLQAADQCERILGSLRLVRGRILGTAAGVGYARALDAVLSKLDAVRGRAGAQLSSARTAAAQAQAASQLAAADASAGLAVSKLSAGPAAAANSQLAGALQASAGAYGSLANAAKRNDAAGYASARASIASADAGITTALTRLSALGYRLG